MNTPGPYAALLLAAAAYRTWRLLAEDDILDRPRRHLLRLGNWRQQGDTVPAGYRKAWGDFIGCAWCLGLWVTLAWWGAWQLTEHWTLVIAAPFAISTVVGVTRGKLDPPQ